MEVGAEKYRTIFSLTFHKTIHSPAIVWPQFQTRLD